MLCIFTNLCAYKFTHSQQLIKSNNLTGFSVICMPFTSKITDPLHNPTLLRGVGERTCVPITFANDCNYRKEKKYITVRFHACS